MKINFVPELHFFFVPNLKKKRENLRFPVSNHQNNWFLCQVFIWWSEFNLGVFVPWKYLNKQILAQEDF